MIIEYINKNELYYDNRWLNSNLEEYRNFILKLIKTKLELFELNNLGM